MIPYQAFVRICLKFYQALFHSETCCPVFLSCAIIIPWLWTSTIAPTVATLTHSSQSISRSIASVKDH